MEDDPIRICRFTRFLLRTTCLWPLQKEVFKRGPKSWFIAIVPISSSFIIMYFTLCHLQVLYKGGLGLSEDIALLLPSIEIYLMCAIYTYHQKDIALLLVDLSKFNEFPQPEGFEELNNKLDFYGKMLGAMVINTLICQKIFIFLEIPRCRRRHLHENCGLVTNSTPKLLSPEETPFLFFSYMFFEEMIIVLFSKLSLIVSWQLYEICTHIVFRLEELKKRIIGCVDCKDYRVSKKLIKKCVRYHMEIIDFVDRTNKCFSSAMFIHLVATALVIASILNHVIKAKYYPYVAYLSVWFGSFWVSCHGGQQLTDISLSVGDAVYNSDWYSTNLRLQNDLQLILMRSQRSLNIYTGPFDRLSFPLYLSVMKTTYTFLTALMTYL